MTPGQIVTAIQTLFSVKDRWNLAKWEARLKEEDRRLAAEQAKHERLFRRDAEILQSPTHGIVLGIDGIGHGHWQSPDEFEVEFSVRIQNTWIYPVTLEKMAVSVGLPGWREQELQPYVKEATIDGFAAHSVLRTFRWKPNDEQRRNFGLYPDRHVLPTFNVKVHAYFSWEGGRFHVESNLNLSAFVPPPE